MSVRTGDWRKAGVAAALAFVLALGACGIKSSPERPPGGTYPGEYPAAEKTPPSEGKSEKTPAAKTAPGGFPYEYPNQPPSSR